MRFRLLGGFEVSVGSRLLSPESWRLRKAKTLVKVLALADGHRVHREALEAMLWADRDAASARNNLHQTLYVARRALNGAAGGLLSLRDDVVLLSEGDTPWIDTEVFDAACRQARSSRDVSDYQAALAVYGGELLPEDRFEDWAEGPREALRERHVGVLVELAEVLSQRGENVQAADVLSRVLAADPFHEGAGRLLMTALSAGGRRYEALAAYDRLAAGLLREYDVPPDPETSRLYRDLLARQDLPVERAAGTSADLPEFPGGGRAGPGADLKAGLLQLPLPRPAGTASGAAHPPRRHLAPAGLRLEQTSFVGRRREIAEIVAILDRARLLTLTGPGGAGKTRLAIQVAVGLSDNFPDGVHVVELAALSRADLVAQTVASALELVLPESATPEANLARQLVERRLLLVLDNCEHLVAAVARLAAELLRSCPGLVVLATSREPLRVGGEVTWRTPSLALPNLDALPALSRLAGLESVQLFVDRARDAAPGFVLDAVTASAVAEICVRLDGMPLALELAAARTSALAPQQIAERLGDALHVLDRGSRSAMTRQQTLHATLTWSHDLLEPAERLLFRRLAVFSGGMALDAVEKICGGGGLDIVDLLSRLVDKSLVQIEHAGGTARYRLLETIRQYADQRLQEAGEGAALVGAHREWYVAFAAEQDPERASGIVNDTPGAVEVEHDNLRAALSSGLADEPQVALRLAVSLWRFWLARGHFSEGSRWLSAALTAAPQRTRLRAEALLAAAAMEVRRGDPSMRMVALGNDAVSIMREVGDDVALARTLTLTGLLAWETGGGWRRTVERLEEGRALAASVGDLGVVASSTHVLGVVALARGDDELAEQLLAQALALLEQLPADLSPFFSVITPGLFWEPGRGDRPPRVLFTETVLLFRRVGRNQAIAYTRSNLAYALRLRGNLPAARALLADSVAGFRRHGDLHGTGLALSHLATMCRLADEFPEADRLLEQALELRRGLGDRRGAGMTLMNQALVAGDAGRLDVADRLMREALLVFEDMEDGTGRSGALVNLGLVLLDAGEHERSRQVLQQWRELGPVPWMFRGQAWMLLSLAYLELRTGDEAAAARFRAEALAQFVALGDARGLAYLERTSLDTAISSVGAEERAEPVLSGC